MARRKAREPNSSPAGRRYLKPVLADKVPTRQSKDRPKQGLLFSGARPSLLGIALMAGVSDVEFYMWLSEARPRWLFDLRPVPRFDIGRLNRRLVFNAFAEGGVSYQDIGGLLGLHYGPDARLACGEIGEYLARILRSRVGHPHSTGVGPVLMLLDNTTYFRLATRVIPSSLQPKPRGGWDVRQYIPRAKALK